MQNNEHTAVEAVASFLKERDENVLPGEADDEERKASAQCIVRVVAKFSSPTNLENAERAEMTMTPHAYAQEYEFRGDTDYTPSDFERTMIEDAILGYLGEARIAERAEMEPKVKPLEWRVEGENRNGPWLWEASSIVKGYTIRHMPNDLYKLDGHGEWATLKAAKAAAQSDFESRIRSCLLDKPEAGEGEPNWVHNLRGMLKGVPFNDEMKARILQCFNDFYRGDKGSPLSVGGAGEVPAKVLNDMLLARAPDCRWTIASILKEHGLNYRQRLNYMRAALEAARLSASPSPLSAGDAGEIERLMKDLLDTLDAYRAFTDNAADAAAYDRQIEPLARRLRAALTQEPTYE